MFLNRTTFCLILMAVAVSVALFVVKYRVQDLNDELFQLNRDIVKSQEDIHVLKSEWSHLNQPDRLRKLADTHLEMGPVAAEQVGAPDAVLSALPDADPLTEPETVTAAEREDSPTPENREGKVTP